jgi:hypothetical protein
MTDEKREAENAADEFEKRLNDLKRKTREIDEKGAELSKPQDEGR